MTTKFAKLSENHVRGIRSMLVCLDLVLAEFELYAKGREVRSVMVVEKNSLDLDERTQLLRMVNRMRELMQMLKDDLGLETKECDLRREIWARSSGAREMLLENDNKHLRRYGAMDGEFAIYWRKHWRQLLWHLDEMSSLGQGKQP